MSQSSKQQRTQRRNPPSAWQGRSASELPPDDEGTRPPLEELSEERVAQKGEGNIPFMGWRSSMGALIPPVPEPAVCPTCKGAGWVRQPVSLWHTKYKECPCLLEKRRVKRLQELLALCERFGFEREKTLSAFRANIYGVQEAFRQTRDMIGRLTNWATQRKEEVRCHGDPSKLPAPKEWLLFMGPVGVGKTHLAMAIGNAALDAGIVTLFATVPDLLDHLRQTFSPGSHVGYDEVFERLKNAEVLLLDDLGVEQSSEWVDEKLFQLLNYRYNRGLPTIITLNPKGWGRLDLRLQSRLSDRSLVQMVTLDQARDYRKHQGKAQGES